MNGTQIVVAIGYGVLAILSTVGIVYLVRSTSAARRRPVDVEEMAHGEARWGWMVAAMLVVLFVATIFSIPYGKGAEGRAATRVDVLGLQFGWMIEPRTLKADVPIEFHIRSRDVQHGFGVYEGRKLLFQVQVPAKDGGEQRYVYTFAKPGTYDVLCLEFCGFKHHAMRSTLEVR